MNNKLLKIALLCLSSASFYGQSYIGLSTDNYSGLHGVIANPANVVDSRIKVEVNLASISTFVANDYTAINFSELVNDEFEFDDQKSNKTSDNNAIINFDVLGPSVLFNIDKKNSIALTTRARAFVNINNVKGDVINLFDSGIDENTPVKINDVNLNETVHAWSEYGVTYGRVLFEEEQHFLKAGVTAKYLRGYGYNSSQTRNVSIDYQPLAANAGGPSGKFIGTGDAQYSFSKNFDIDGDNEVFDGSDDYEFKSQNSGIGFDLGLVYEYRPDHEKQTTIDDDGNVISNKNKNKYFLKASLAVTDIGSLKYKDSPNTLYNLNTTIAEQTIEDGDFEEIEGFLSPQETRVDKKIKLPAALHANVDWHAIKMLYVNLATNLSMINQDTADANRITNSLVLTPRFETKWIGVHSPISFRQYAGTTWGAGLRLGPLYVGSASAISNLFSDESKSVDFYFGLKVPIYQRKPKN